MDPLKQAVANAVRAQVMCLNMIGDITNLDFEVRAIDTLNTSIRIPTLAGPRYFLIKVSEQM